MLDFSLYLITNRHQVPGGDLVPAVRRALEGGVRAVQLREKDLSAAELFPLAETLRKLTREYGARLLINDRIDVALGVEADGVHLGGHSLPPAVARDLLGADRLIGISTHRLSEILEAERSGADFVTYGPVWYTPSKASYGAPVGLAPLAGACAATSLPLFALGGVTLERVPAALSAGATGVALISAILAAPDPAAAARAFSTLLQ